jgi:alpha-N-arabinofuranosidase
MCLWKKNVKYKSIPMKLSKHCQTISALAIAALTLSCADQSNAADASADAQIIVHADHALGAVNRYIFGHNMEAANGDRIFGVNPNKGPRRYGGVFWDFPNDRPIPSIVERSKDLGMGMMRYPGGCLAHDFDWRRAVGDPATRKKGEWAFGIDEFIEYCRQVDAEPMITVSDYVLPPEEMPKHAADLVEYLNAPADSAHPWAEHRKEWGHPEPYHVKWFELGNETNHGNHNMVPHRKFTPEGYGVWANACAKAMREVDPSIKIGVITNPGGLQDVECEWNRTITHLTAEAADYLVVHAYAPVHPLCSSEEHTMQACMAVGEQIERHLEEFHQMAKKEAGHDLPLAITEYNADFPFNDPKPYRYSLGAALYSADLIRVFLDPRHNVATANFWQFLNGYWGILRRAADDPQGLHMEEKAPYKTFRLWGHHFKGNIVDTEVHAPHAGFDGSARVYAAAGDTYQ